MPLARKASIKNLIKNVGTPTSHISCFGLRGHHYLEKRKSYTEYKDVIIYEKRHIGYHDNKPKQLKTSANKKSTPTWIITWLYNQKD